MLGAVEASEADKSVGLVDPAPAARHGHLHTEAEARPEPQGGVVLPDVVDRLEDLPSLLITE